MRIAAWAMVGLVFLAIGLISCGVGYGAYKIHMASYAKIYAPPEKDRPIGAELVDFVPREQKKYAMSFGAVAAILSCFGLTMAAHDLLQR